MAKPGPEDGQDRESTWSSVRALTGGHERTIVGLTVTGVLSGFVEAGILAVIAQVGASLAGAEATHLSIGPVDVNPGVDTMLVFAAVLSLARIGLLAFASLQRSRLASNVLMNLRTGLFGAFAMASWEVQSTDREAHLQEMLTSQSIQATAGTLQLASLVTSLLTFAALVLSALLLDPLAAAIVVIVALLLFALLRPLGTLGRRNARELRGSQLDFAGGVGEAVRMAEETHVFGTGGIQSARLAALADVTRDRFFRTQFLGGLIPALFQSLIYLTVVAGLALLYATNASDVGSLGAVVLMMVRAGSYGQQVQSSYQGLIQALPFVEHITAATARYAAARATSGSRPIDKIDTVGFADVSYRYRAGRPVLSGISFEVAGGEKIGVVGPSGAGKSTLVQLLLQLRSPTAGSYELNGVPAPEFDAADWHRHIAYVPQKPQLIHASVADNIRFFRDIDDESVERAARLARIDEEIRQWSEGYETLIGPRADSISGGQQQRICLARALAAEPQMLVLDEPTSALDPRSEALIQESLDGLAGQLTLFVVTHRMTMLAVCDRVLVIIDGRVDAFGRTHALRETNEYLRAA